MTSVSSGQQQHVISGWLLRAIAGSAYDDAPLALYDKQTDSVGSTTPAEFMVELDAHSSQVERGIGKIEGPASQAAQDLAKRVRRLPPALYAVVGEGEPTVDAGPELSDEGVFEGMRLFVGRREIGAPPAAHRLALSTFVGLMYQRAPKTELSIRAWGVKFDAGVQWSLNRLLPGMKSGLGWKLEHRRERMVALAANVGERLANTTWWIVRTPPDQALVLGDSPVVATSSLGHDDGWRAILADDTNVLAMPLAPGIALVLAPRGIMPVSRMEVEDLGKAINRLSWRWAERYVIARHADHLKAVIATMDENERRASVDAAVGGPKVFTNGVGTTTEIYIDLMWRQWDGCRMVRGIEPFPAEDRDLFVRPGDHVAPPKPLRMRWPARP